MKIFNRYLSRYEESREETLSLHGIWNCARPTRTPMPAPRTVAEGHRRTELVDTRDDPSSVAHFPEQGAQALSRLRGILRDGGRHRANRFLSPARRAGLEEKKQILYLLGPVGGGKSSLAERLKQLMERYRFTPSPTHRCSNRRWGCSIRRGRPDPGRGFRHPAPLPASYHVALGRQALCGNTTATSPSSGGESTAPVDPIRSPSPRPNRAMRTIRTFLAGGQGRHPQIGAFRPERPGRFTVSPVPCAGPTRA